MDHVYSLRMKPGERERKNIRETREIVRGLRCLTKRMGSRAQVLGQPWEGAQPLRQSLNQEGPNRWMETRELRVHQALVEKEAQLSGQTVLWVPGAGRAAQGFEPAVRRSREAPGLSSRIFRHQAGAH